MKKKIFKKIIFIFLAFFSVFIIKVKAASINVIASSTSITKGETVTVTVILKSDNMLFFSEGTLICNGAGLSNKSLDLKKDNIESSAYTQSFNIKPTSSGTVTCSTSGVKVIEATDPNNYHSLDGNTSITVKEPTVVVKPPKEYSSNNNLKNLTIDGYNLEPEFNKETLEYEIEVPNHVEKISVSATSEDSNAKVTGVGEIAVNEGANKIEIKVEAENGNVKTYILNVIVKDLNPITVKVDKKEYTIIKKEGVLDPPSNFEKNTVKIGDQEVLCYTNSKTKTTLVILKDNEGVANFYIYDEKTKSYTKYNSISIGNLPLSILAMPKDKLPSGYSKVSFTYEDNKLEGYQIIDKTSTYAANDSVKGSDFYLFYAVNELTGKEGLYVYDKLDGTIQRYNSNLVMSLQNKVDNYFLYFLLSIIALSVSVITFTIILINKKKHHKKKFA